MSSNLNNFDFNAEQSLYNTSIGIDFDTYSDNESDVDADISTADYDSLMNDSVPFDDVFDTPTPDFTEAESPVESNMNLLDEIEAKARDIISSTEVIPEMKALFESGEADTIRNSALDKIKNSNPSQQLKNIIESSTPEEIHNIAREGIAQSNPSPELKKIFKPIQSIPKELMLKVDDLSRRTGFPKKYVIRNLEAVAEKIENEDFQDFINTKTGPRTREHMKYPYNRARMRDEFALLTLEPELQRMEEFAEIHRAYSQILQLKELDPDFNDLEAQYNFWHKAYPNGIERGKAIQEFKPYIDELEDKFWEFQEDYEESMLRAKGMKEDLGWVPNIILNIGTALGQNWAGLQNIIEETAGYLTGSEVQLGAYSGDRYQRQMEMAIEMLNNESYGNWISPEWYQRGRNIITSLSTAVKGTAAGGIGGASVLFGMDAFAQGVDAADEAGLKGSDVYDFAANEAFTEFGFNMLGGKVFGAGVEAMLGKAVTKIGEKGFVQAFKDYGKDGVKNALKSFGGNLAEENLEEIATEITHAVNEVSAGVDPDALSSEKLVPRLKETAIQSSIMGGAPASIEVGKALLVNRAHKNYLADMSTERVKKVKAAIESSELIKKNPQELEKFLTHTLPGLKGIQVDGAVIVDTYAQSDADFESDMKELGLNPENVRTDSELGVKTTIDAPKMLTSEAGRRLLETVGLESVNEIGVESTEESRKATEELQRDIEKIQKDLAAQELEVKTRHEFLENIEDIAKFQGIYKKRDTKLMTTVWNSALENLFKRAGMTAEEFFKDVTLEVEESYAKAVSNYEMGKNKYIDLSKLSEKQKSAIINARKGDLSSEKGETIAAQEQDRPAQAVDKQMLTSGSGSVNHNVDNGETVHQRSDSNKLRGWLATTNDGKKILHLSKNTDASTLMHEMMHLYVDRALMLINDDRASEEFKNDIAFIIEFADGARGKKLTKDGNEKIARAFEAYLMEGKAPSPKLVNAFNSFKKWLTAIYRTVKSLNVELNDDVRGVFDRMLASENEIEKAHSQYYPLKDMLVDMYEADKEKADEIRSLHKRVRITSEEKLLRRAMRNWKTLKGGVHKIRKDARAEVEKEEVYSKTIPAVIKSGGLNFNEITEQYGSESTGKLKKHSSSLIKKNGTLSFGSPELFEIAADNNMTPEQFIEYLIDTPKINEKVKEVADKQIAARETELRKSIEEGNEEDLSHSSSHLLLKIAEYDLLMNTINKNRPGLNNRKTELSAVNTAAREVLEKETSSVASSYYKYSQAEKRAGRDARKTLSLAGDSIENVIAETERKKRYAGKNQNSEEYKRLQDRVNLAEAVLNEEDAGKREQLEVKLRRQIQGEAATYVYREMLNHALVLEAVKAREMVRGVIKKYGRRKIDSTTKNVENVYRDSIYAIARKFKLIPEGRVTSDSMKSESSNRNTINPVVGTKPIQNTDNDGDPTHLPEQLKNMMPDDLLLPDWIARSELPAGYKSIKDLTIEQVKELDQVLGELIARGKTTLDVIKIHGAETIEEAVKSSINCMEELGNKYTADDKPFFKLNINKQNLKHSAKSLYDTTLNWMRRAGAHMTMMEFMAIKADGFQMLQRVHDGKKGGAFFGPMQSIMNTASRLDAEFADKFNGIKTDLRPHLMVLEAAKKRIAEKYGAERFKIAMLPVPEKLKEKRGREFWDAEMLLMCALNLGNSKNEYALLEGYELMPSQLERIKQEFTSEEWRAIQGIWDTVNTLFKPLDAVHFRLTNRHLIKEEPKAFTAYTADGEYIDLKGGYFPLKYDTRLTSVSAKHAEVEAMLAGKSGTFTSAVGTKMGMTKSRLEDEEGNPVVPYPPSLSISSVLQPHLRDTLRVITHAEFINEVDKITSNEQWRDTFISKFGFDNYKEVRDWVGWLARPNRKVQSRADKTFDWIKNRNTQLALGFRFKTGVKQRLSIFNGINAMGNDGLYWLIQGYKSVGLRTGIYGSGTGVYGKEHISEQVKAIHELSPEMKVRSDNISREISDYLGGLTHNKQQFKIFGKEFGWDDVKEAAFWWIKVNDLSAVYPLWQGAFMQAMDKNSKIGVIDRSELKEGMSEDETAKIIKKWQKQAGEYADHIIRSTQPTTLPSALSGLQRQEGILRFFTSFMTFTLKAGNRLGMYYSALLAGKISPAIMIKHVMLEWISPALSMVGLAALCYSGDDEPEWYDWAFAVPESMASTMPIARDVSAGIRYRSNLFELPGVHRISDIFTKHDLQSFLLIGELATGVPAMNVYRDAIKEHKKISNSKEK